MRIYEPFNFPDELATAEHPKPESGEALYWYETAMELERNPQATNAMTISNAVLAEALRTAINIDNVFDDAEKGGKNLWTTT